MIWCDCRGSIGQYLVRTGVTAHKKEIAQIRHTLENGLDPNKTISEQIELVLKLFKYGELYLTLYKSDEWHIIDSKPSHLINFHPLGDIFICTQPKSKLNIETITKYKALIKSGKSPVILTTSMSGDYCTFVIDGHHKLEAYNQLNQSPNIVNIAKPYSEVSITEGARALKDQESLVLYKKIKASRR